MSNLHAELHKKAQAAALQYAVFRWESAVILAGTLLLAVLLPHPFPWWPGWAWPALGAIALATVIFSSLTDADTGAKVLRQLLEERLDPNLIKDEGLRGQLLAAFTSLVQLETWRLDLPSGTVKTQVDAAVCRLMPLLTAWVEQVFQLLRYLDTHRRDFRVEQRREQMNEELKTLSARRRFERNPQMLTRLDEGMEDLGKDWYTLRLLTAELRLAENRLPQHLQSFAAAIQGVRELQTQTHLLDEQVAHLQGDLQEQTERLREQVARIHRTYTEVLRRA
ncbi:MAG: hypothetical protein BWY63_00981 [Chloroflexi bacterium ADurb.Bin360]|nr:MAG: hypothetical protein BWY63_00981 [Chloroflexi bacterium ADurb.Bin360]